MIRLGVCFLAFGALFFGSGAVVADEGSSIVVQFVDPPSNRLTEVVVSDQSVVSQIRALCPSGASTDAEVIDNVAVLLDRELERSWGEVKWWSFCQWCSQQTNPPAQCKQCG